MGTRSQQKYNAVVSTTTTPNKQVENSWILLSNESLLENTSFSIISLPHPALRKPAKYCLDDIHRKVFEIVTFNEPHRSWFIDETVKSDGSIQILTPVNPIFLVLPRLKEQCSSRAVPLEDLLSEKGFHRVLDFIDDLDNVADLKGSTDLKAYKYNEEKTLLWLKNRVCRVAKVLQAKDIHVTSGAVSATFVTSNVSSTAIDEEFYLKYAFGMVSEYLEDDLVNKLKEKFDFKPDLVEAVGNKRKSEADHKTNSKKCKIDRPINENGVGEDKSSKNKTPEAHKLTMKEKKMQKSAKGSKAISSFFSKK